MSDAMGGAPEAARAARRGGYATGWWGTILGIAALATAQATVAFAYLYLGTHAPAWPPEGIAVPPLPMALAAALVLVVSALPAVVLHRTGRGARRVQASALATFALGAVFLLLQGASYPGLGFAHATHAYGSAFFVLVGFHHLTALVGLGMLFVAIVQTWGDEPDVRLRVTLQSAAIFWYYVVVSWLAVLALLYVSPRL